MWSSNVIGIDMSWRHSTLQWPRSLNRIHQQACDVLNHVDGEMTAANGRLSQVGAKASFSQGVLSADAVALLSLRQQLDGLLVSGQQLCITPYQFGIGSKKETGHVLSSQNAIEQMILKLRDPNDSKTPGGHVYAVMVLLSAKTLAEFAQSLQRFGAVVSIPEWQAAARQASSELTIEQTKFDIRSAPLQPRFKAKQYLHTNPLRDASSLLGSQLSQLESLSSDKNTVVQKLYALAIKRVSTLNNIKTSVAALSQISGDVHVFCVDGSINAIATTIEHVDVPNANYAHSAVAVMLSDTPLDFFTELFS